MGRQEILGFVLIGVVLLVWIWMTTPPPPEHVPVENDTIHIHEDETPVSGTEPSPHPEEYGITEDMDLGRWFSHREVEKELIAIIETELFTAEITSKGGLLRKYELKEYKTWDGWPVQLVEFDKGGDLSLLFTSTDGKLISTRNLYFDSDYEEWERINLSDGEEATVTLGYPIAENRELRKHYTFYGNRYDFDIQYEFIGMHDIVANYEYQIVWDYGVRLTEYNSVDESEFAGAFSYIGGELEKLEAKNFDRDYTATYTGATDWVSSRNKYFALAMIPRDPVTLGAYLEGYRERLPDNGVKENYSIALRMPFRTRDYESARVSVFLGPMDFRLLKSYDVGLDRMASLGWRFIRPISEFFVLPLFRLLNSFIPNFGLVIIIFSIIVKVLLHPLTKKQMQSMRKMQKLQPMMTEVREKYKEDPQRMNREMMKLYQDYGINPASGCLPMLPQLPILFALFTVFRSTIELRQEGFAFWITDLSVPDKILTLPFDIPILGVDYLSGLALLMGLTMFIQQKMTMKDPRQQALVYILPIMLTLLFTIFPAGLNLYYFMFNLLSVIQQYYVNKKHGDEPLRKIDPKKRKKGGIFTALEKQMQLSQAKKKMK